MKIYKNYSTYYPTSNIFFRKDSDPRLENLAAISGGKTYFVKDGKFLQGNSGIIIL